MSENWSWKRTGPSKDQKLLFQTNLDKIFGTKWSNLVKLDKKRKVRYLFLRAF